MSFVETADFSGPGPEARFRAGLAEGKILIQRCDGCSNHVFYPRLICPSCDARKLRWVEASGNGVVYSTTTVRQAPDKGGDYNLAIVALSEGPRLMSQVVGIPPTEIRINMSVRAVLRNVGEQPAIFFEPA